MCWRMIGGDLSLRRPQTVCPRQRLQFRRRLLLLFCHQEEKRRTHEDEEVRRGWKSSEGCLTHCSWVNRQVWAVNFWWVNFLPANPSSVIREFEGSLASSGVNSGVGERLWP